jgi:hypothetical protein
VTSMSKRLLARDPSLISEADLSSLIVEVARLGGWRRYHTFSSKRSAHGYPDWTFVKGERLLFVELKSETGKLRDDQAEWLDALAQVAGVETYVWRPSDWDELVEVLTGRKPVEAAA